MDLCKLYHCKKHSEVSVSFGLCPRLGRTVVVHCRGGFRWRNTQHYYWGAVPASLPNSFWRCFIRRYSKTFRLCAKQNIHSYLCRPALHPRPARLCVAGCRCLQSQVEALVNARKFDEFLYFISLRPCGSGWCRLRPLFHAQNTWLKTSVLRGGCCANYKFFLGTFVMKRVHNSSSFCRGTLCKFNRDANLPVEARNASVY